MSHGNITRIACWSGPRNISTAMLRSWDSRADTSVCDEPLYAFYLERTGIPHPGREEVLLSQSTDWRDVAKMLTGPVPGGRSVFYQKHMAHHLLPEVSRDWLSRLRHVFLIREPREMLTSYARVIEAPRLEDTGLSQQLELWESLRASDIDAPILDARDVLECPEGMLRALCSALELRFDEDMLSWEAGPRATDGVWAPHWYAAVEASTGFAPYRPKPDEVSEALQPLLGECQEIYDILAAHRLRA